ncbi:hypothetical protein GEMRC1_008597 [Eukaryota sp. GEM-RC1]
MAVVHVVIAAIPCLVTIILGYLCLQFNLLPTDTVQPVNDFLVLICFPVLLIKLITGLDVGSMSIDYILVSLIHRLVSLVLGFILGPLLHRTIAPSINPTVITYATFSSLVYTNTVVIGFPMALVMFGEESLDYLVVSCSLDCVTLLPAAIITMGNTSKVGLLKNPIILSVILGIVFKILIPAHFIELLPVQLIFDNFAPSVSGGLLFVIGMSYFVQTRTKNTEELMPLLSDMKDPQNDPKSLTFLFYCFFLRFVMAPLLMVIIGKFIFRLPPKVYAYAVFSVANPLSIACFGISKKYKKGVSVISSLFIYTHFLMVPAFIVYAKVFQWEI